MTTGAIHLLGVPSMAMSLAIEGESSPEQGAPNWETPMRHGSDLVRKLPLYTLELGSDPRDSAREIALLIEAGDG